MILNTLDNLGKFEAKRDEGYFIGYTMSSKAFRVFNKRTKRVEENLHVDFLKNKAIEKGAGPNWVFNKRTRRVEENLHVELLENKAIEKGAGPNWLFDIDSLTKSMNYVPVDAGTNSTNLSGTKDAARQEVKKDVSSLRYIALPNWVHDALLEYFSTDQLETLTVETPIPTISSLVPTACLNDSSEPLIDSDGVEVDSYVPTDSNSFVSANGNSQKNITSDTEGNIIIAPPVTIEEHMQVQREEKARTMLLTALPDEHMGDFYHMIDAKQIWNAIKT
nr:ribonuclease H-like domain-containing protein [Tanacetum cinerariifolium]